MTLISMVLIIAAVSAQMGAAESPCTSNGFKCRDKCKELVRCTLSGNNTFFEQVVRRCAGTIGTLCNVSSLDCSGFSCEDDELDSVQMTCHENGFYPHPVKCDKYFSCNDTRLLEFVCPGNSVYNAKGNNCSSVSSEYTCVNPIPRCEKITDIGAYRENQAVYYVCAYDQFGYLRPELHRCMDGFIFDNEQSACVIPSSGAVISVNVLFLILMAVFCIF